MVENYDYMLANRGYGEGERRIGKNIYLSNDIYSIGFISMIRDNLMEEFYDINKTSLDKKDIIRKKARRFHVKNKKNDPMLVEGQDSDYDDEIEKSVQVSTSKNNV